jgi:hypothetical protein
LTRRSDATLLASLQKHRTLPITRGQRMQTFGRIILAVGAGLLAAIVATFEIFVGWTEAILRRDPSGGAVVGLLSPGYFLISSAFGVAVGAVVGLLVFWRPPPRRNGPKRRD